MARGTHRLVSLVPGVADAVRYGLAYLDAYGIEAEVTSAGRTSAEQQRLYDLYKAGRGAPANRPGTSAHEYGLAVDIASIHGSRHQHQQYVIAVMQWLGFVAPYSHEPWHFEVPEWRRYAQR